MYILLRYSIAKVAIAKEEINVKVFNDYWLMIDMEKLILKNPLDKEDLKDKIVNRYN